jgi:hypothetical protein
MIIRTFSRLVRCGFSEGKVRMVDGIPSDVGGMENISQLPFYLSFKQGLNLTLENRLEEANQHYQQSLNLLDDRKEQLRDHYLHIHRKYAPLTQDDHEQLRPRARPGDRGEHLRTHQAQEEVQGAGHAALRRLRQSLPALPQAQPAEGTSPAIQAILLGRALLSDREADSLSLKHRKLFLFNLANAYLLVGNYPDAKLRYGDCLESQPSPDLKHRLYNNLALACWWGKNPLVADRQNFQPEKHRGSSVDSDFKQSRELFLRALEAAENPDSLPDEQEKYKLKQAIAEYELDLGAKFSSGEAVLPIYNLAQYYIHNEPAERVKILYWLRTLLKLAQAHASPLLDETYTTLCLLANERQELANFIPQMLAKHAGKIEEVYFSKIAGVLAGAEGRAEEGKKLMQHAVDLE